MSAEDQRVLLRRYLLGELPDSERSELGDRYFVDDDLFDQLLEVENELVDDYVYGKLPAGEALRFGDYLTSLPDGATKLATAYTLKQAADERRRDLRDPSVAQAAPAKVSLSRPNGLVQWITGRRPAIQYALAIVLVMLISAVALLTIRRQFRPYVGETEQARQTQSGKEQQADASNRQSNGNLDQQAPLNQSPQQNRRTGRAAETGVVVLLLTPSVRSGSTPDLVTVSAGITTLSLVISRHLEERVSAYRAVLQTTDGKLIESRRNLRPRRSGDNQTVTLRVSVNQLKGESFKLTLLGKSTDDLEFAEDFYFNVVRK